MTTNSSQQQHQHQQQQQLYQQHSILAPSQQEPQPSQHVALDKIIELGVQKTYHDLVVLSELLPRKADFARKIEIMTFVEKTRQIFIRLLALVKWAGGASLKIEQCMHIVSYLDKQSILFTNTADNMYNIARNTLSQARLPAFQVPTAVEVLTLGTYSRMPSCIRDKIIPPEPISLQDKVETLDRLNFILKQRLSQSLIHESMRKNFKVEYGRAMFRVDNEFELKLTLLGCEPKLPWTVLSLDLLCEDSDVGEGKDLVHSSQIEMLRQMIQAKMNESPNPLHDVYTILHSFCLSLQIEVLHEQTERLLQRRLSSFIKITEHIPGQKLSINYWKGKNTLKIQADHNDLGNPLKLTHEPEFNIESDKCNIRDLDERQTFSPNNISIEYLITYTIHQRVFIKLNQLANELQEKKYGDCSISGTPALLHVSCLKPCAPSEELIISIDLNGSYLAHVPQYERTCQLADSIQESLNTNLRSKLGTYFDQLKIWLMKNRFLKTICYLSVTATESLPLCSKANHTKLDDRLPRLFFHFNKYNQFYLMTEFSMSNQNPLHVETSYSLLQTEPAMHISNNGYDIESDTQGLQKDLIVIENILPLDLHAIKSFSGKMNDTRNILSVKLNDLDLCNGVDRRKIATKYITKPIHIVNELMSIIGFCEDRLAHIALEKELKARDVRYEVMQSDASGFTYCLNLLDLPKSQYKMIDSSTSFLHKDAAQINICFQEKASTKLWHTQYLFRNVPNFNNSNSQDNYKFVVTPYDSPMSNAKFASKFIDDTLFEWISMSHMYNVVREFANDAKKDPTLLDKISVRSFSYKKFIFNYGPNKNLSVIIMHKQSERKFHLTFGVVGGSSFSSNPHSYIAVYYKHEFNQNRSIKKLIDNLSVTIRTMRILQQFPTFPIMNNAMPRRHTIPVSIFSLIYSSTKHIRLVYKSCYCISVKIVSENMLTICDGSQSKFDRTKNVEGFLTIPAFETLLQQNGKSQSYTLSVDKFEEIFNVANVEQHLEMQYMMSRGLGGIGVAGVRQQPQQPQQQTYYQQQPTQNNPGFQQQ